MTKPRKTRKAVEPVEPFIDDIPFVAPPPPEPVIHKLYPWQLCGCPLEHEKVELAEHVTAQECGCALPHVTPTIAKPEPPPSASECGCG